MNMAGAIPGTNIYIILSTHRTLHQNMQGRFSVSWIWLELFQVPIFTLSCPPIGHCTKTCRDGVRYHEHGRSYFRYQYLHYLVSLKDIAPKHAGTVFGIMNMAGAIPGTNIYIILSTHRTLCQNTQADLSLRWALMPFCWFCHEATHLVCNIGSKRKLQTKSLKSGPTASAMAALMCLKDLKPQDIKVPLLMRQLIYDIFSECYAAK